MRQPHFRSLCPALLAVIWTIASSACGAAAKSAPVHAKDTKPALVVTAEDIVRRLQQLDYRAPASDVRRKLHAEAAALYLQACQQHLGTSPCVWAVFLARSSPASELPSDELKAALQIVAPLCLDGHDVDACRVFDVASDDDLSLSDAAFYDDPNAMCARGLATACEAMASAGSPHELDLLEQACDLDAPQACLEANATLGYELRDQRARGHAEAQQLTARQPGLAAELTAKQHRAANARCARGYPQSCLAMADAELKARSKSIDAIAFDACNRGYLYACTLFDDPTLAARMTARYAGITGTRTDRLASELREAHAAPTAVRDVLEHGCQLGDDDACRELVGGYRATEFPEPVPGRADTLGKYLCSRAPDEDQRDCMPAGE